MKILLKQKLKINLNELEANDYILIIKEKFSQLKSDNYLNEIIEPIPSQNYYKNIINIFKIQKYLNVPRITSAEHLKDLCNSFCLIVYVENLNTIFANKIIFEQINQQKFKLACISKTQEKFIQHLESISAKSIRIQVRLLKFFYGNL